MTSTYMDYACIGKPRASTVAAVLEAVTALQQWQTPGTEFTTSLFTEVERARESVARFFHVPRQHIALMQNTTEGLGTIASLLPLEQSDNILIADIEFMSSALVWRQVQRQRQFEIRVVKTEGGGATIEDFLQVMDEQTRAIVVSAVQEVSGYRIDLQELMKIAERNGTYLIVDGIQEAGVLYRDLSETPVHVYCAGGHKWLGSPFGLGFMYIDPRLSEQLNPAYEGYLNLVEPAQGWGAYLESRERSPFDPLILQEGAIKFESGGNPNWLGAVGLHHALQWIEEQGIQRVEEGVKHLHSVLIENLERIGLGEYIVGSRKAGESSSMLTFSLPGGLTSEKLLLERLEEKQIYVSLRSIAGIGGIRVSPYVTNSVEDIHALTEVVEEFIKGL